MTEILSVTIMTVKIIVTGKYPAFFRFQDIEVLGLFQRRLQVWHPMPDVWIIQKPELVVLLFLRVPSYSYTVMNPKPGF